MSSKFITIYDSSGVEVFKVDASKKSSDITFRGRILEFGFPPDLLFNMDTGYQLVFDAGVAKGATKCGLESEAYEWSFEMLGNLK